MKSITCPRTIEMLISARRDGGMRRMHFSCGVEPGSNANGPVPSRCEVLQTAEP